MLPEEALALAFGKYVSCVQAACYSPPESPRSTIRGACHRASPLLGFDGEPQLSKQAVRDVKEALVNLALTVQAVHQNAGGWHGIPRKVIDTDTVPILSFPPLAAPLSSSTRPRAQGDDADVDTDEDVEESRTHDAPHPFSSLSTRSMANIITPYNMNMGLDSGREKPKKDRGYAGCSKDNDPPFSRVTPRLFPARSVYYVRRECLRDDAVGTHLPIAWVSAQHERAFFILFDVLGLLPAATALEVQKFEMDPKDNKRWCETVMAEEASDDRGRGRGRGHGHDMAPGSSSSSSSRCSSGHGSASSSNCGSSGDEAGDVQSSTQACLDLSECIDMISLSKKLYVVDRFSTQYPRQFQKAAANGVIERWMRIRAFPLYHGRIKVQPTPRSARALNMIQCGPSALSLSCAVAPRALGDVFFVQSTKHGNFDPHELALMFCDMFSTSALYDILIFVLSAKTLPLSTYQGILLNTTERRYLNHVFDEKPDVRLKDNPFLKLFMNEKQTLEVASLPPITFPHDATCTQEEELTNNQMPDNQQQEELKQEPLVASPSHSAHAQEARSLLGLDDDDVSAPETIYMDTSLSSRINGVFQDHISPRSTSRSSRRRPISSATGEDVSIDDQPDALAHSRTLHPRPPTSVRVQPSSQSIQEDSAQRPTLSADDLLQHPPYLNAQGAPTGSEAVNGVYQLIPTKMSLEDGREVDSYQACYKHMERGFYLYYVNLDNSWNISESMDEGDRYVHAFFDASLYSDGADPWVFLTKNRHWQFPDGTESLSFRKAGGFRIELISDAHYLRYIEGRQMYDGSFQNRDRLAALKRQMNSVRRLINQLEAKRKKTHTARKSLTATTRRFPEESVPSWTLPMNWPDDVQYTPILRWNIPKKLLWKCMSRHATNSKIQCLEIRKIHDKSHPCYGQYGAFAKVDVEPGTRLGFYTGEVMINSEKTKDSRYIVPFTENEKSRVRIDVDADKCGNELRFVNDYRNVTSGPNCSFELMNCDCGMANVSITTTRSVAKGDEFFLDYGEEYWKVIRNRALREGPEQDENEKIPALLDENGSVAEYIARVDEQNEDPYGFGDKRDEVFLQDSDSEGYIETRADDDSPTYADGSFKQGQAALGNPSFATSSSEDDDDEEESHEGQEDDDDDVDDDEEEEEEVASVSRSGAWGRRVKTTAINRRSGVRMGEPQQNEAPMATATTSTTSTAATSAVAAQSLVQQRASATIPEDDEEEEEVEEEEEEESESSSDDDDDVSDNTGAARVQGRVGTVAGTDTPIARILHRTGSPFTSMRYSSTSTARAEASIPAANPRKQSPPPSPPKSPASETAARKGAHSSGETEEGAEAITMPRRGEPALKRAKSVASSEATMARQDEQSIDAHGLGYERRNAPDSGDAHPRAFMDTRPAASIEIISSSDEQE